MTDSATTEHLDSITTWLSGGTPNRDNSHYWNGAIPWISAATLKQSRIYGSDQHITNAALRAGGRLAPKGAVLVLVRGMALHRETRIGLTERPVSFNQDVKALIPKPGIAPEFLLYALQARSSEILRLVSLAGSGTGVLDTNLLKRLPIWVPEPSEQRAIVDSIDFAEQSIISSQMMITKKQAVRQAFMQHLLVGRTRLPGFYDSWRSAQVGEILEFKNGLNKANRYFGSGTPIVNFMDVMRGPIIHASRLVGQVEVTRDEIKRFSAKCGDLFFTRTSETVHEVGTAAVLVDDIPDVTFSGFILRGRPRSNETDSHFLAQLFGLESVRRQITSAATYTTRALTNGRSLSNVLVELPSRDEQRAIADVIADCDAEVAALRAQLKKARAIKTGILQQLLTGRIRLHV